MLTLSVELRYLAVEAIVLADEIGDEGILRRFIQRLGGCQLLDDAVIEDRDAVRHGQRFRLIMGHIEHGDAEALVDALDLELHLFAQILVQRPQRFIHQHQLRLEDQRTCQGDPLLLPAGELPRTAIAEFAESHHVQRVGHLGRDFLLAHAAHFQREGQILGHAHVRKQRIVLEDHADTALVRWQVVDGGTVEEDVAVGRRFEACHHHQAGGLAGTGRPQQGDELAALDFKIEALDHQRFAVIALLHIIEDREAGAGLLRRVGLSSRDHAWYPYVLLLSWSM